VLTHVTADVDIRVRVRGGGHISQVYAIRQAIAKSIVRPTLYLQHPAMRLQNIILLPTERRGGPANSIYL